MSAPTRSPFNPAQIFAPADAEKLAAALKALADPTRLRILHLLAQAEEPLANHTIQASLGLTQPTASHQLKILDDAGLIRTRKLASKMLRSLDAEAIERLSLLIDPIRRR